MTIAREGGSASMSPARCRITAETINGPAIGLSVHGKIDLCRGLLSWLVVLCHAFQVATTIHPSAATSLTPSQYALLDHTVNAGFVWVMGFFVLSGYCIHQAVARRLSAPTLSLKLYLAARLSRILPLYYLALGFAVIAEPWLTASDGLDVSGLVGQIFLVQNLTHQFGSFTPSWSLTNEVFYYLLYGVLAATVGRHKGWPFWIGMGLCLLVGSVLQLAYLNEYRSPFVLKTGMLFGLGFNWFLGVGVAVYREEIRRSPIALALARAWPLVLALGIAGYHQGLPIQTAYLGGGLAFALLLIRIVAVPGREGGIIEPPWATRFVHFAGLSSYPTYLFHFTFMWLLAKAMIRWNLVASWVSMMGLLVASSLAFGAVLGWYAERPIMRWRAGFLARLERPDTPGSPTSVASRAFARPGKEAL